MDLPNEVYVVKGYWIEKDKHCIVGLFYSIESALAEYKKVTASKAYDFVTWQNYEIKE